MSKLEVKPKLDKRINILIDEELHTRAKEFAAQFNMSFSDMVRFSLNKIVKKK